MSSIVWSRGGLMKRGIWSFYIVANLIGSFLDGLLLDSIYRLGPYRRLSLDWPVAGLHLACAVMSLTCAAQCLLSAIDGVFFGDETACRAEAIFHVTAVVAEFGCLALMAVRNYLAVVHRGRFPESKLERLMFWSTVFVLLFSYAAVLALMPISDIYLVSSGVYCFFAFHSADILLLVAFLVGDLLIMIVCYVLIFREYRRTRLMVRSATVVGRPMSPSANAISPAAVAFQSSDDRCRTAILVGQTTRLPDDFSILVAEYVVGLPIDYPTQQKRHHRRHSSEVENRSMTARIVMISILNVAALLVGWIFAAVATVYELSGFGEATEFLTVAVGIGGVLHSSFQPLLQFFFRDVHRSYITDRLASVAGWFGIHRNPTSIAVLSAGSSAASKHVVGIVSTSNSKPPMPSAGRSNDAVSPVPSVANRLPVDRDLSSSPHPFGIPLTTNTQPTAFDFRPADVRKTKPIVLTVPAVKPVGNPRRATAPVGAFMNRFPRGRSLAAPDTARPVEK